jgi:hypothetical protein
MPSPPQQQPASFDMPRYRALRPLQPAFGWLLAGGRPAALPLALLAVGPLAVALGSAACGRQVAAYGRSRWWGLGFGLVPGVVVVVAFATAEPLGLALAALGLSLAVDRRFGLAEATVPRGRPGRLAPERLWPAMAVTVPGVAGLGLWWLHVLRSLPASASDTAGAELFTVPLAGWAHTLARVAAGDYRADAPVGLLGPLLLTGSLVAPSVLAAGLALVTVGWPGLRHRPGRPLAGAAPGRDA